MNPQLRDEREAFARITVVLLGRLAVVTVTLGPYVPYFGGLLQAVGQGG